MNFVFIHTCKRFEVTSWFELKMILYVLTCRSSTRTRWARRTRMHSGTIKQLSKAS